MYRVQFFDIGPRKLSWDAELTAISFVPIRQEMLEHGHLISSTVNFSFDERSGKGVVFSDGTIPVGKFKIID